MSDPDNHSHSQFITELRASDVLLGRGSGPNDHEGNIRFRQLVSERKDEYMATNHRLTKARIAQEIVDHVLASNGRFLRKLEGQDARDHGVPEGTEAWLPVDEDTIMEKAKQALRQNTQKRDSGKAEKPLGLGDLEPIPIPMQPNATMQPPAFPVNVNAPIYTEQAHTQPPNNRWSISGGDIPVGILTNNSAPWPASEMVAPWSQTTSGAVPATHNQQAVPQQRASWTPKTLYQQEMNNETANFPMKSIQIQQPQQHIGTSQHDPDSMIAMLPPKVISTYLNSNNNHSSLPASTTTSTNNHLTATQQQHDIIDRRGSMTMGELAHAHINRRRFSNMSTGTDEYSEIMDSVSKMSVAENNERRKMFASTETMGTIEGMVGDVGSVADMSFATVDSSAFSISKPNEYASSSTTSGDTLSSGGGGRASPNRKKLPLPDRNAYAAMSGNLGALSPPPAFIRPEDGARRRGRRTSIDMAENENHDILESAEYVYYRPARGQEDGDGANGDDGEQHRAVADMPKSSDNDNVKAPADGHELDDMGASSLSFKVPFNSSADLDMNSALFEIPPDGKDW